LRPGRRKRYKEMSGFDVLVEYLPGARMSFRWPADGVEGPEYIVMDTGITALVELLYTEPVPAGIVAGRTA
jgi:hypothetical protein